MQSTEPNQDFQEISFHPKYSMNLITVSPAAGIPLQRAPALRPKLHCWYQKMGHFIAALGSTELASYTEVSLCLYSPSSIPTPVLPPLQLPRLLNSQSLPLHLWGSWSLYTTSTFSSSTSQGLCSFLTYSCLSKELFQRFSFLHTDDYLIIHPLASAMVNTKSWRWHSIPVYSNPGVLHQLFISAWGCTSQNSVSGIFYLQKASVPLELKIVFRWYLLKYCPHLSWSLMGLWLTMAINTSGY